MEKTGAKMASSNKKTKKTEDQKKNRGPAIIRMFYGFLGIIVSTISIIACIVYKGPLYLTVSFFSLLMISVILIISGKNLYKN